MKQEDLEQLLSTASTIEDVLAVCVAELEQLARNRPERLSDLIAIIADDKEDTMMSVVPRDTARKSFSNVPFVMEAIKQADEDHWLRVVVYRRRENLESLSARIFIPRPNDRSN